MSEQEALEERLRTLKAARAEREAARDQAANAQRLQEEIAAEEQAAKDAPAIAAAEAEHGASKIAVVDTPLGAIVVKRPNHLHYKRFQDKGSAKSEDVDRLVRPCVVYPTKAEFDHIVEELPATLGRVGDAVIILAGHRVEELSGK